MFLRQVLHMEGETFWVLLLLLEYFYCTLCVSLSALERRVFVLLLEYQIRVLCSISESPNDVPPFVRGLSDVTHTSSLWLAESDRLQLFSSRCFTENHTQQDFWRNLPAHTCVRVCECVCARACAWVNEWVSARRPRRSSGRRGRAWTDRL